MTYMDIIRYRRPLGLCVQLLKLLCQKQTFKASPPPSHFIVLFLPLPAPQFRPLPPFLPTENTDSLQTNQSTTTIFRYTYTKFYSEYFEFLVQISVKTLQQHFSLPKSLT